MKFDEFVKTINQLPVIDTENLLAGVANQVPMKVQITRWAKTGKLIQLKRGMYVLAEPYRKREISELHLASVLRTPSYISLEKAFEYYGLIPEAVKVFTSVTTKREGDFVSPIGRFRYQHVKASFFWGYQSVKVQGQIAFIALPEKALLDLFYLNNTKVSREYLEGLRLQNLEQIDLGRLTEFAKKFAKPGIARSAMLLKEYIENELSKERRV